MKFLTLSIISFALTVSAANVRDLYLPPWHVKASRQIFQLELTDVKANRILLDHPCTVSLDERIVAVTNGVAKATLSIDLRTTPSTFPLVIVAVDANGRMTEYQKLMCHLSLVTEQLQVRVRGETFAITNLTEEPFQIERTENLTVTSQGDRHILGTLRGSGRLKLRGRAEISLVPNRPVDVVK